MSLTFRVSFDADDPPRLARFWAAALGYESQPPPEGFDSWPAFAESVRLAADEAVRWPIRKDAGHACSSRRSPKAKSSLLDPEGNEFCVQ